jgi:hypothetical protein
MVKPGGFRTLGASALSSPSGVRRTSGLRSSLLLMGVRRTQVSPLENLEATASDLTR